MNSASNDNTQVLSGGNRLTIETIAEFVQQIRTGLNEANAVVVALPPDVEVDVTALQTFCSACKTAAAEGKRFACSQPLPQAVLDLIAATGSARQEQCPVNSSACFRRAAGEH